MEMMERVFYRRNTVIFHKLYTSEMCSILFDIVIQEYFEEYLLDNLCTDVYALHT